jgi:hypothetical protein
METSEYLIMCSFYLENMYTNIPKSDVINIKKANLSLLQAVKAHKVLRCRDSHIF